MRRGVRVALLGARAVALVAGLRRLATAASASPPLTATEGDVDDALVSVVIPARDEAGRVANAVRPLVDAPGVREVIVVDDQSTDATATVARAAGATVVTGAPPPPGWAGKVWALEQGWRAARSTWVVCIDADVEPDPMLPCSVVGRATASGAALTTVAGRFVCPTPAARWLHASMLTTLVYRFGAPGAARPPDRVLANGQCMVFRRADMEAAGGLGDVAGEVVEDVALARRWSAAGREVAFVDGAALMRVRMYDDLRSTWTGWGRSLALPGVEPRGRQLLDLAVVAASMPLPLLRLLTGRVDPIDGVALAARFGTLLGTRTAYDRIDVAYWLSPLADPAATVALLLSGLRRRQTWKGRRYDLGSPRTFSRR